MLFDILVTLCIIQQSCNGARQSREFKKNDIWYVSFFWERKKNVFSRHFNIPMFTLWLFVVASVNIHWQSFSDSPFLCISSWNFLFSLTGEVWLKPCCLIMNTECWLAYHGLKERMGWAMFLISHYSWLVLWNHSYTLFKEEEPDWAGQVLWWGAGGGVSSFLCEAILVSTLQ